MAEHEVASAVSGERAAELADWASLWADLLYVDMALHARRQMPDEPSNVFVRRALWEAAVIAYGRTAKSGRRQRRLTELLSTLGPDAERCHQEVIAWRDRHVAHRVDDLREEVNVDAVIDPDEPRLKRLRVRVAPALGPEDEGDLATRFERHVKAARDHVWTARLPDLESEILREQSDSITGLLEAGRPVVPAESRFAIDIDPSGRS